MLELAGKTLGYINGIWTGHVYPLNVSVNLAKGCEPKKRKRLKSMYCHSVDLWTVEDVPLHEVVLTCGLKTFIYMK